MRNTHTAILLFSKFSQQKRANDKVFLRNKDALKNQQIAATLLEYTQHIAQKTKLPLFWIGAEEQVGETFGERISHATQQVLNKGFQHIIIIGDDCPSLSLGDFQKTLKAFSKNQASIGLAKDGGTYLIGITRQHFQKNKFTHLAWQKQNLGEDLIAYLNNLDAKICFLSTKSDIDNYLDWAEVMQLLPYTHRFKKSIQLLFFTSFFSEIIYLYLYQPVFYFSQKSLRAPPSNP